MGTQQQKSVNTMSVIFRAAASSLRVLSLPRSSPLDVICLYMYAYDMKIKIKVQMFSPWNKNTEYCHPGGVSCVICKDTQTGDLE